MFCLSRFSPFFFLWLFNFGSTASSPTFSTRLVHYLSVDAPTLYSNLSMRELSYIDLERSMIRATHLANNNKLQFPLANLETTVVKKIGAFFAVVHVGANLLPQHVYMDTGSTLLWFYCEPCIIGAPEPLFDPKDSYSFERENCIATDVCSSASPISIVCDGMGKCTYDVSYGKGYSKGYLGRDELRFERGGYLPDVVFGCARHSSITGGNGILGLRNNSISLMGQMGASKFAYCIGNITDRAHGYSRLLIGDEVELNGYITPLITQGHYYVNLDQIKIGKKKLNIDPQVLRRDQEDYTGGLLLDTGSTYTYFPLLVVEEFEGGVQQLIGHLYHPNSLIKQGDYPLRCYKGVVSRDLRDFPIVQFIFESGATMELRAENVFRQFDNEIFCLAIIPSDKIGNGILETSILGNIMQQHYYFVFDLKQEKLAFMMMDSCTELDPGGEL